MKKNLLKLISLGATGCFALGFQVISTLHNEAPSFDATTTVAEGPALKGSAAFKHDLYLGDDDPKKPTVKDNQLLAYYGD